ncbi:MAG TPA: DUF998 domain-containing protein [Acidimicrobiales bacterium]|nr:DUF998 domain-containing protein [Acidimicrobiales bacterium]
MLVHEEPAEGEEEPDGGKGTQHNHLLGLHRLQPAVVAVCGVVPRVDRRSTPASPSDGLSRAAAWGGVVGPVAFAGAWLAGGILRSGYDPVEQAISRLAETGSSTQALMTAGFAGFSVGVLCAAPALARHVSRPVGLAAAVTAVATAGVALTPLHGDAVNTAHRVLAVTGYISLSAVPLLAAPSLAQRGLSRAALASAITAAVGAAVLAATATGWAPGLLQRTGLTIGHTWLAAASAAVATGRLAHSTTRHRHIAPVGDQNAVKT